MDKAEVMSKKLINNPVDAVDEALAGLVASCPGVNLLKGHRVIVRADVEEITKQGKVNDFTQSMSASATRSSHR